MVHHRMPAQFVAAAVRDGPQSVLLRYYMETWQCLWMMMVMALGASVVGLTLQQLFSTMRLMTATVQVPCMFVRPSHGSHQTLTEYVST